MTHLPHACTLLACLASPLCAQDQGAGSAQGDPVMAPAIAAARSHLDLVLTRLIDAKGKIHPALNLKASFPVSHFEVKTEMLWVDRLSLTPQGDFTGHLANTPAYMPGHHLGDIVTFSRDQIADWSVLSADGRMYGHYTTRVLLQHMSPDKARQIADLLSSDPLPDLWR